MLSLYKSVPSLINVDIHQLNILDRGDRLTLKFNMPYYTDNQPKKWIDSKYNTTVIELDFFCIKEINFKSVNNNYHGDIEIYKDNDGLIHLNIQGSIEVYLTAEACLV